MHGYEAFTTYVCQMWGNVLHQNASNIHTDYTVQYVTDLTSKGVCADNLHVFQPQ